MQVARGREAGCAAETGARVFHRSAVRRAVGVLGVAFLLIGVLLAPIGAIFGHGHTTLSDEDEFVAAFAPLATDPGVQRELTRLALEQIDIPAVAERALAGLEDVGPANLDLRTLEIPPWLLDSTDLVAEWGVPEWLAAVIAPGEGEPAAAVEDLGARATQLVEDSLRQVLGDVLRSAAFRILWRETLREAHAQVRAQLHEPTSGGLAINAQPIIAAARSALIADGMAFARLIPAAPTVEYSIEILTPEQVAQAAPATALVLRFGSWIAWAPLALIAAGLLLTPHRRAWVAISGVLATAAAGTARAALNSGAAEARLTPHLPADPILSAAARAWADAVVPAAVPTLTVIAALGLVTTTAVIAVTPRATLAQRKRLARFAPERARRDEPAPPAANE